MIILKKTWTVGLCTRNMNSNLLICNSTVQNQVLIWALEQPSRPWQCVWMDSSHSNSRSKYDNCVDIESLSVFKMLQPVNSYILGCLNNFRNSSGLHYHQIPKDCNLLKEYVQLLRNRSFKLDSNNTRIWSSHFEGRENNCKYLQSIFPWMKAKQSRRPLQRKELSITNESFTGNLGENALLGHAMAMKNNKWNKSWMLSWYGGRCKYFWISATTIMRSALSIFICRCSYSNQCVRLQCKWA